jgi:hypothetical protein
MQVLNGGAKRDIIETLREMLEMAEGGELTCVGVVWAKPADKDGLVEFNNTWATDDSYNHSFVSLLAAFEVAKYDLIRNSQS